MKKIVLGFIALVMSSSVLAADINVQCVSPTGAITSYSRHEVKDAKADRDSTKIYLKNGTVIIYSVSSKCKIEITE